MQFIDTNIFLRYLTQDDPVKTKACYTLFKQADDNEVSLTTSEAVIAEVVYVLASPKHYGLSREAVKECLYPLLSLRGLSLSYRKTYLRALDYYARYALDYEDCLTITHMERRKLRELYSYDRDFDNIQYIKRLEPQEESGGGDK